jgi:hypothetical protein
VILEKESAELGIRCNCELCVFVALLEILRRNVSASCWMAKFDVGKTANDLHQKFENHESYLHVSARYPEFL